MRKPRAAQLQSSLTTPCASTSAVVQPTSKSLSTSEAYPALQAGHKRTVIAADHPDYIVIQNDLAAAGQVLRQLVLIKNERLADKFNLEKEHLMRAKPPGLYYCLFKLDTVSIINLLLS